MVPPKKNLENLAFLERNFDFEKEEIEPRVFLRTDPRGILLRGKIFVAVGDRQRIRTGIIEGLMTEFKKHKDINIRFVNFGEGDTD